MRFAGSPPSKKPFMSKRSKSGRGALRGDSFRDTSMLPRGIRDAGAKFSISRGRCKPDRRRKRAVTDGDDAARTLSRVHWVEPQLVAEGSLARVHSQRRGNYNDRSESGERVLALMARSRFDRAQGRQSSRELAALRSTEQKAGISRQQTRGAPYLGHDKLLRCGRSWALSAGAESATR